MIANATKDLTNQDETIEIRYPEEFNGGVAVFAGPGAGTLILEFSGQQNAAGADEWVGPITMLDPTTNSNITSIVGGAGTQMAWAEGVGIVKARIRKSVAGGGTIRATLALKRT